MTKLKYTLLGGLLALILFSGLAFNSALPWQPPQTDDSIDGNGTHEAPLAVNHPVAYAAIITQASTSAPTAYELENEIDATAFTWTRDSIGSYKVEGSDLAFPDSTFTWTATLGTGAGAACRFFRQSDSTGILKILSKDAIGIDQAGKVYVLLMGDLPD